MNQSQAPAGQPTCLVLVRDSSDPRNPDPGWSREIFSGLDRLASEFRFWIRTVDPRRLGIQEQDSEIFRLIQRADLVIVDVHAASSDYMYLLGARHALTSRPTVILNRVDYLPFDVKGPPAGVIQATEASEMIDYLRSHLRSVLDNSWHERPYSLLRQALEDVPHVFLSYAHADKESVVAVDQWLRDRGARVDIDARNFVAGQDIRDEIVRVVSQAGKVVCFYSRSSENRYYTRLERRIVENASSLCTTLIQRELFSCTSG